VAVAVGDASNVSKWLGKTGSVNDGRLVGHYPCMCVCRDCDHVDLASTFVKMRRIPLLIPQAIRAIVKQGMHDD
jgi:hypothetical protein